MADMADFRTFSHQLPQDCRERGSRDRLTLGQAKYGMREPNLVSQIPAGERAFGVLGRGGEGYYEPTHYPISPATSTRRTPTR